MHPRIQELLDQLDAQHDAFRAAIATVPQQLRERRPHDDAWSAAEVIEHMCIVDERLASVLRRMIAQARADGVGPETDDSPVVDPRFQTQLADRSRRVTATEASLPTGTVDAATAEAELERHHADLLAAVREGDGLALGGVSAPHPRLGTLDWYRWVAFAAGHEARHAAQIREIATQLIGVD